MDLQRLKTILDSALAQLDADAYIANDPICVPKRFTKQQDIEIMAFFAAIFAWGQRPTTIKKTSQLGQRLGGAPYSFILSATNTQLQQAAQGFVHRTFSSTDLLNFLKLFRWHYQQSNTLQTLFFPQASQHPMAVELGLVHARTLFIEACNPPTRTLKHFANPLAGSACKRLLMFLRWMVRPADGIDYGFWHHISPTQLVLPVDLHVHRTLTQLGITQSKYLNWKTALAATNTLRQLDPNDPVKYDVALFSLSASPNHTSK